MILKKPVYALINYKDINTLYYIAGCIGLMLTGYLIGYCSWSCKLSAFEKDTHQNKNVQMTSVKQNPFEELEDKNERGKLLN